MNLFGKEKIITADNLFGSLELGRVELPILRESNNNKFVNYGADNRYPDYLINLTKTSALHRTLIENKAKMVTGSDMTINDMPVLEWLSTLSGVNSIRIQNLFFNRKYPIRDWLKRASYDYQIFGAYTTECIWSSDFEYVKVMKHVDTSKIRSGIINKDGEIDKYYYSRNWMGYTTKDLTPYSTFDVDNTQDTNQIIYKRDYYPSLDYYSEPSYTGALTYINLDSELGLFNLSHLQNGLNPGLIFKVPMTIESPDQKAALINELMKHYRGSVNNKNPLILFNNGEKEWTVEKVDVPDYDAQLNVLFENILQQLIFGHRITNGALVGLMVPGKLGGSNAEELAFSERKFKEFTIEPARLQLEEVLEDIIRTYNLNVKVKIID
jgi:hypothetical protein